MTSCVTYSSPEGSPEGRKGGPGGLEALAQLADLEGSSWGPKGSKAASKYGSFSADLDFDEFLERQSRFLEVKLHPLLNLCQASVGLGHVLICTCTEFGPCKQVSSICGSLGLVPSALTRKHAPQLSNGA